MLERVRKQTKEPKSSDEQIDEINDALYELKKLSPGPPQGVPIITTNIVDKVIPEEHGPSSGCHDCTLRSTPLWEGGACKVLKSFEVRNQQQALPPSSHSMTVSCLL